MHVMTVSKAGMQGVNKEKVSKIIAENTSANYSNFTAKQQKRVDERVEEMKKTLASVSPAEWARSQQEVRASGTLSWVVYIVRKMRILLYATKTVDRDCPIWSRLPPQRLMKLFDH